ncbi:hypothetical protein DIPPA_25013 [Diplonema papillatum]|nr:hypothetical protein DIPPA_25013 [Diplonema papillatum]
MMVAVGAGCLHPRRVSRLVAFSTQMSQRSTRDAARSVNSSPYVAFLRMASRYACHLANSSATVSSRSFGPGSTTMYGR